MTSCPAADVLGWIECHSGLAAWVQAIGAILALAIAIFVPVWMARNSDGLSRPRFLASVASICGEAQECFADAAKNCGSEESGRLFVRSVEAFHRFRIVSAAINAIPVHQLPSYGLTRSVLELQRIVAEGLMQSEAAFNEVEAHGRLVQFEAYAAAFSRLATLANPHLTQIEEAARTA